MESVWDGDGALLGGPPTWDVATWLVRGWCGVRDTGLDDKVFLGIRVSCWVGCCWLRLEGWEMGLVGRSWHRETRLDGGKVSDGASLSWTRRLDLLGVRDGDGLASAGVFSFLLRLDLSGLGI